MFLDRIRFSSIDLRNDTFPVVTFTVYHLELRSEPPFPIIAEHK